MIPKQELNYNDLQRRLKSTPDLTNYSYRGERTFIIISGMNSDRFSLTKVKGLVHYEERLLFFLFLLRHKRTKIVYLTSTGFDTSLFDYYLSFVAKNQKQAIEMKNRITHIEVANSEVNIPLAKKILDNNKAISLIKRSIQDTKTNVLRCYNPTAMERKLSVKLQIPLFAPKVQFDFAGTKSGSRKIFRLAKVDFVPGYSYLKNSVELSLAMAKLLKNYPYYKKLVIKLDESAAGRGNAVFNAKEFLKENEIDISIKTDINILAKKIRNKLKNYLNFQLSDQNYDDYIKEFNKNGGVAELFIPGDIKYSPSTRVIITPQGKANILSAHEQVLGGPDNQKYLGSSFPANTTHRKIIIKETKKVADWMAKKGMMGNFSVDFLITYKGDGKIAKLYCIEINLRKIGSTSPFVMASYLTNAKYNHSTGILTSGAVPIHYLSMDFIESEKYKKLSSRDLVQMISKSKLHYNKNTKKGIMIYMPGLISQFGRFGALCIGHSDEEAKEYYKRLLKLINYRLSK